MLLAFRRAVRSPRGRFAPRPCMICEGVVLGLGESIGRGKVHPLAMPREDEPAAAGKRPLRHATDRVWDGIMAKRDRRVERPE